MQVGHTYKTETSRNETANMTSMMNANERCGARKDSPQGYDGTTYGSYHLVDQHLRTLYLDAPGSGQGSSTSISNISTMTTTDDTLTSLTDIMANFEKLSFVGNTKLGLKFRQDEHGALADVIRRVGRKCKVRAYTTDQTY